MGANNSEKYSEKKFNDLKRYLEREKSKGRAKHFEVHIDGLKFVSRTSDLSELEGIEEQITDETHNLTITVYDGPSTPRNTKHSFDMNYEEFPATPVNGLGSLGEVEHMVQKLLKERETEREIEDLRAEVEELEDQVDERQKVIDKLEKELDQLTEMTTANRFNLGGVSIAEVLSETAKIYFKGTKIANPAVAQVAGVLGALAGIGDMAATATPEPSGDNTQQATFTATAPTATEIKFLATMELLEAQFKPQEMEMLCGILEKLRAEPQHLLTVAQLLNVKLNQP